MMMVKPGGKDSANESGKQRSLSCRSIASAIQGADAVVSALGYSGFNLGAHLD